ncbi:MAG: zeta toxin family protein [Vagococcus sp.]|nr:zeta toxin family protein [Vagococcus sp.]
MKPLNDQERASIFAAYIEPRILRIQPPSDTPLFISIGGQPGSGKTLALKRFLGVAYPQRQVYTIIGDEYRAFHPNYSSFIKHVDPEVMPRETADFSGDMVRRSLQYVSVYKCDTCLEGTFRQVDMVKNTISRFRDAGFRTHAVVLAVPPALSLLGCIERYITAKLSDVNARWTPLDLHDDGVKGTRTVVQELGKLSKLCRLTIVDRDGKFHFDKNPVYCGKQNACEESPEAVLYRLQKDRNALVFYQRKKKELMDLSRKEGLDETVNYALRHADSLSKELQI